MDLVIDLGSENIKIFRRGAGLILNEPALALIDKRAKFLTLKESGLRAKKLALDLMETCVPVRPIKAASVADVEIAAVLAADLLRKADVKPAVFDKLRVVVPVACGLSFSERKSIISVMKKIGAKKVHVVDGLSALHAYAGVEKGFFVDLGAAAANIGFVDDGIITEGCQADLAGEAANRAIMEMLLNKYGLEVGRMTAEKLKTEAADLSRSDGAFSVGGRDIKTGRQKTEQVFIPDISEAVIKLLSRLVLLINSILCSLSQEDYNFVCKNGIFLAGGFARLSGVPEYLAEKLLLRVRIIKDCEIAAACGSVKFFDDF